MAIILCIGRQYIFNDSLKGLLECEGYEVFFTQDHSKALSLMSRRAVDVLICDLSAIEEEDFYFLRKIRSSYASVALVPVILIAGLEQQTQLVKALYLCSGSFIPSPLNHNILLASIKAKIAEAQEQRIYAQSQRTKENYLNFFMLIQEIQESLSYVEKMAEVLVSQKHGPIQEAYLNYAQKIKTTSIHLIALINDMMRLNKAS